MSCIARYRQVFCLLLLVAFVLGIVIAAAGCAKKQPEQRDPQLQQDKMKGFMQGKMKEEGKMQGESTEAAPAETKSTEAAPAQDASDE